MTSLSKIPNSIRQIVNQISYFLSQSNVNRRVLFTVSIGAIGISIAAKYYYYHLMSLRKKRNLNKSFELIEMVIISYF